MKREEKEMVIVIHIKVPERRGFTGRKGYGIIKEINTTGFGHPLPVVMQTVRGSSISTAAMPAPTL